MSSLGSEGEDEAGLWSLELQDRPESLDKSSLTASDETEEPRSPGSRNYWGQVEAAEEPITTSTADKEGDPEPLRMFCKFGTEIQK